MRRRWSSGTAVEQCFELSTQAVTQCLQPKPSEQDMEPQLSHMSYAEVRYIAALICRSVLTQSIHSSEILYAPETVMIEEHMWLNTLNSFILEFTESLMYMHMMKGLILILMTTLLLAAQSAMLLDCSRSGKKTIIVLLQRIGAHLHWSVSWTKFTEKFLCSFGSFESFGSLSALSSLVILWSHLLSSVIIYYHLLPREPSWTLVNPREPSWTRKISQSFANPHDKPTGQEVTNEEP